MKIFNNQMQGDVWKLKTNMALIGKKSVQRNHAI